MNGERRGVVSVYAQGSIPEYEHDGDEYDRYYLPARSLCFQVAALARRDLSDLFVLPDSPEVRNYYSQLIPIYEQIGMPRELAALNEPVFVPDDNYFLDENIKQNLDLLESRMWYRGTNYRVLPYAHTQNLAVWVSILQEKGVPIEVDMPLKVYYEDLHHVAHRGGWGRHVSDPEMPTFAEEFGIPYPTSFIGQGLVDTVAAYRAVVDETGNQAAYFKPVFSAGGFTIKRIVGEEDLVAHYHRLEGQGVLNILGRETPVEIQSEISGIKGFYSIQYDGEQIISPRGLSQQIVEGTSWIGNVFNNGVNRELVRQAERIFHSFTESVANRYCLRGFGGMDLALTEEDGEKKLIVIEHNGQRITGGHPAIALAEGFGITGPYMTQKAPGEVSCDLNTLWELLSAENCQYDPITRTGVFPIVWMRGSGMLWMAGKSEVEMRKIIDSIYNQMIKENYVQNCV